MNLTLDFDDVLIKPKRSTLESRKDVEVEREFQFYYSPRIWKGVPIICSNMSSIAGFQMAKALGQHKIITCLHKYLEEKDIIKFFIEHPELKDYVWVSIGYSEDDIEKLNNIRKAINYDPNICIDVPNGYIQKFVTFCSKVRDVFPESIIMGGNVCTYEMVQELIIHGKLDVCKVQIGSGSGCTTRMMTGVGYGSLSCVQECSKVAHGLKSSERKLGLVCSDGGCKYPGDVCKAFCGGADFVMLGKYFGGTAECDDVCEWEKDEDGNIVNMIFYGMSTHYAQKKHSQGKKNYRASEGTVLKIPYKGSVHDLVQELLGGIKSCCAFIGANRIKDMNKCAEFVTVNKIHDNFYNNSLSLGQ